MGLVGRGVAAAVLRVVLQDQDAVSTDASTKRSKLPP